MPRFEHPCCFLSFRTTIVHTNSHPGLFMFPFVTLVFSQPPSQSLSTESKYPPIQNATKQLMKTEAWDCARSIHPLYLYFIFYFNGVSILTQYPQYLVFNLLLLLQTMILPNLHVSLAKHKRKISSIQTTLLDVIFKLYVGRALFRKKKQTWRKLSISIPIYFNASYSATATSLKVVLNFSQLPSV